MCLDEEVSVVIPPHLAFDDPSKKFEHSPVSRGTSVRSVLLACLWFPVYRFNFTLSRCECGCAGVGIDAGW
jgi:hypothetical protein